ncbi:MAG: hypothetical protein AAF798_03255 [Bacteroidota bacterium]
MQALLEVAIAPYNIVYTGLFMMIILYWITVMIGALDIGAFDFDIDVDTDVDIDVDVDVDTDLNIDTDSEVGSSVGWFASTLHFFNFGRLPFMIVMSFLVLSMWAIAVLGNFYVGQGAGTYAWLQILPNLFVSLLITKIITIPLIPIFKDFSSKGVDAIDYIGQVCTLKLPATSTQIGQAEVRFQGDSLLITVKAAKNSAPILKGEEALIVNQEDDGKYYIVKKLAPEPA